MKTLLALILMLASTNAFAWCQQVQLPDTTTPNLSITVPAGTTYLIQYQYPPNATSVGLEYFYLMFPDDSTGKGDMWMAWYLNDKNNGSRRIGMAHKYGQQPLAVNNHAMSIRMNPGEWFIASLVNRTEHTQELYFGVTLMECYP